ILSTSIVLTIIVSFAPGLWSSPFSPMGTTVLPLQHALPLRRTYRNMLGTDTQNTSPWYSTSSVFQLAVYPDLRAWRVTKYPCRQDIFLPCISPSAAGLMHVVLDAPIF